MKDDELTRTNPEPESAEGEAVDMSDERLEAMNGGRDLLSDDSNMNIGRDQSGPLGVAIC